MRQSGHHPGDRPGVRGRRARTCGVLLALLWPAALWLPAVGAQEALQEDPLARRHVYLPVEELGTLLEQMESEGVLMDLEEYLALRAAARREVPDPPPPTRGAVRQLHLRGRLEGDGLLLEATLQVELLVDGWVRLPCGLYGAAISRVEGKGVEVYLDPAPPGLRAQQEVQSKGQRRTPVDDGHHLLLRGAGLHQVTMELAVPVRSEAGDRRVSLGLPRAAAGELRLTLPGRQEVESLPPLVTTETRGEGETQTTQVRLALGGVPRISLRWHQALEGSRQPVLTAVTSQLLHLSRDVGRLAAALDVTAYHAPVEELLVELPEGLDLFTVEAQDLGSWALEESLLRIRFRTPFSGIRQVRLTGEVPLPEGDQVQLEAPILVPRGTLSRSGSLGVSADSRLRVTVAAAPPAYRRVAPESVGVTSGAVAGFRYGEPEGRVSLAITADRPRLEATCVALLGIEEGRLVVDYGLQATARGGPGFAFDVVIPAGWQVGEVTGSRGDYEYELVRQEDGATLVRGRLGQALPPEASFQVQITAQSEPEGWRDDWERRLVEFPMPGLPDADLVDGFYGVTTEPIFEPREESARDLLPLDVTTLREVLPGMEAGFAYRLRGEDPAVTLELRRKPTRTDLQVLLRFTPEDETLVKVKAALLWTFAGGGARELEISLPPDTGDQVRFEGEGIAERSRTTHRETGRDLWKLVLQERRLGRYLLLVSWDLHRQDTTTPFQLPDLVPHTAARADVRREQAWIVVEAGPEVEVITSLEENLERIAQVELPPWEQWESVRPTRMLVEQYRYHDHTWRLHLDVLRHDPVDLLGGYARRVDVDTFVDPTGVARSRVQVQLRNGTAQFFALQLPEGSELWSAHLDGEPMRPSRSGDPADGGVVLVPVTRLPEGFQSVELWFQHALAPMSGRGALSLAGPSCRIPVLESSWTLHLSPEVRLLETDGDLRPDQEVMAPPHLVQVLRAFASFLRNPLQLLRAAAPLAGAAPGAEMAEQEDRKPATVTAAEKARIPVSQRRAGMRSITVAAPDFGVATAFRRLGGDGQLLLEYRHRKRQPQVYWCFLLVALLLGHLAMRRGGRKRRHVVLVLLVASGLFPYLLGTSVTTACDGLFGAAVVLVVVAVLRRLAILLRLRPPVAAAALALVACGIGLAPEARAAEPDPAAEETPIYILYDGEDGLPGPGSPGQVYVPDAVFQELYRRAAAGAPEERAPGERKQVLERVHYQLALDGQSVRGSLEVHARCFGEEWAPLPLGLGGLEIRTVTLDGEELPARVSGRGLVVDLQGPGPHTVRVEFRAPLEGHIRQGRVRVPVTPSPLATVAFVPHAPDLEVSFGSLGGVRRQVGEALVAHVGAISQLQVAWGPREAEVHQAVLHARTLTRWLVEPAGLEARVVARYSVQRGAVPLVTWELPSTLRVVSVVAEGMRDWSVQDSGGTSRLQVLFVEPLRDQRDLSLELRGTGDLTGDLARLAPVDVDHEVGFLGLFASEALDLDVTGHRGLSRVSGIQDPGGWGPPRAQFTLSARPIELALRATPRRPELAATVEASFSPGDLGTLVNQSVTLEVSQTPLHEVDLELPPGLQLSQVAASHDARVLPPEEGETRLRYTFTPAVEGSVTLTVAGLLELPAGGADAPRPMPLVRVPGARSTSGSILVGALDDRQPRPVSETGLVSVEARSLGRPLGLPGEPALAYRFRTAAGTDLVLQATALSPRVEVHVLTDVHLREDYADVRYALSLDVTRAGIDQFSLDLPVTAPEVTFVELPAVRFVESEEVETPAGPRRRWRVTLQGKVREPFGVEVALPVEYDGQGRVHVPGLAPVGVARCGGHVIVENASRGQVSAVAATGLVAVERREVPGLDPGRRPALAFRAADPGLASLELEVSRFQRQRTESTSVDLMRLTSVLSQDGTGRHEVELQLTNRDRQFLEFRLPEGATLWTVWVAGEAVRPVAGKGGSYRVRIRKTAPGERASDVELTYVTPPPPGGALGARGQYESLAPTLVDLRVVESFWSVHLPDGYRFTGHGGDLEPADQATYFTSQVERLRQEASSLLSLARDETNPQATRTMAMQNALSALEEQRWFESQARSANDMAWERSAQQGPVALGDVTLQVDADQLWDNEAKLNQAQDERNKAEQLLMEIANQDIAELRKQQQAAGQELARGRKLIRAGKGGAYAADEETFLDANRRAQAYQILQSQAVQQLGQRGLEQAGQVLVVEDHNEFLDDDGRPLTGGGVPPDQEKAVKDLIRSNLGLGSEEPVLKNGEVADKLAQEAEPQPEAGRPVEQSKGLSERLARLQAEGEKKSKEAQFAHGFMAEEHRRVEEQARQLDDVVRQLGARYYQDLGRPQPPAGPAGEPAPDATEEDVELAFDMPAEAPAAIAPRPTGAPADPGAMVDAESRSRRDRARQRSSRRPQPAARGDEEGAEAEELEREANGYFYQDSNTDIRGRTEALWNTRSLTVGGGGGGTFGGRFGGRRAAETTGTPGTAAIGLRSLAVELPRNEITASFRTSGAAGQLVITYITQERSRTYAALGATGAALIILASLWWILASLQVRVTVRGAVGLTVTVVGIVLALAGLPLWGTPVAAVGAVLTPWKGKLASRAASATPSTARED